MGGALNVPWASTRACVAYLVRTMVGLDIPSNDGLPAPGSVIRVETSGGGGYGPG